MNHVAIVGAGPAGASLAYLLAHRGIRVTLLERQRDFGREFRGEFLLPSGIEAIEQMGLSASIAPLPQYQLKAGSLYLRGKPVFSVEAGPDASEDASPRAISQPAMLEMLVAEAAKSPLFTFIRGASIKDLLWDDERAIGVRLNAEEGTLDIHADLVIGADGRNSAVRKHAGVAVQQFGQPMDIVWFKLPRPDDWKDARFFAGRGHLLVSYPTWGGNIQLGWMIVKGTFGQMRNRGMEEWVEEMASHVSPDLAAHLRAHANEVQKPFLLSSESSRVDHWSAPGFLLIGDAAHTASPVGGQGVNLALRDAVVAANHLVPVLSGEVLDRERLADALHAIEKERMPEIVEVQKMQARAPKITFNQAWWGEPFSIVLGFLLKRRFFSERLKRRGEVLWYGTTKVRLRV